MHLALSLLLFPQLLLARIYLYNHSNGEEINLPVHEPVKIKKDETLMRLRLEESCPVELFNLPNRFWSLMTAAQLQSLLRPHHLANRILHQVDPQHHEHLQTIIGRVSLSAADWAEWIPAGLKAWCQPAPLLGGELSVRLLNELMDLQLTALPQELEMIAKAQPSHERLVKLHCALGRVSADLQGPRTAKQLSSLYRSLTKANAGKKATGSDSERKAEKKEKKNAEKKEKVEEKEKVEKKKNEEDKAEGNTNGNAVIVKGSARGSTALDLVLDSPKRRQEESSESDDTSSLSSSNSTNDSEEDDESSGEEWEKNDKKGSKRGKKNKRSKKEKNSSRDSSSKKSRKSKKGKGKMKKSDLLWSRPTKHQ